MEPCNKSLGQGRLDELVVTPRDAVVTPFQNHSKPQKTTKIHLRVSSGFVRALDVARALCWSESRPFPWSCELGEDCGDPPRFGGDPLSKPLKTIENHKKLFLGMVH